MKKFIFFLFILANYRAYCEEATGAGSSFIAPVMYKWSYHFQEKSNQQINYQSIGSGAGIQQIENHIIDFGASDMPLSDAELSKNHLEQFPIVVGGILMVVHLDGITPGQLILDSESVSKIYSGYIKKWNNPHIQMLNPTLKLPDLAITVLYRADGSGTTYNFTNYLEQSSPKIWKFGHGTSIHWPDSLTGMGGKGNEGISSLTKRTNGSIGYIEYSYAIENKLSWTRMKNSSGNIVPNLSQSDLQNQSKINEAFKHSFETILKKSHFNQNQGMSISLINSSLPEAWPMTACSYILIPQSKNKISSSKITTQFFHYALEYGAQDALSLNYIPMPDNVTNIIYSKLQ